MLANYVKTEFLLGERQVLRQKKVLGSGKWRENTEA